MPTDKDCVKSDAYYAFSCIPIYAFENAKAAKYVTQEANINWNVVRRDELNLE